jgi:hypothetical protein
MIKSVFMLAVEDAGRVIQQKDAEIERLRTAGTTALEYLHGLKHMGSLVDQEALARDTASLEAAIGGYEQPAKPNDRT